MLGEIPTIPSISDETIKLNFGTYVKTPRYSIIADSAYMQARMEGDYDAMRATLDDVAMRNGYPLKVYHGTRNFGFTIINPDMGDDGFSFYTTTSAGVASTYSGTSQVRAPHENAISHTDRSTRESIFGVYKKEPNRWMGLRGSRTETRRILCL